MQEYILAVNNYKIPKIGFGCCFGSWRIPNKQMVEKAVLSAITTGYQFIDSAAAYKNEAFVGNAIKSSGKKRSELFISGKLWNNTRGYDDTLIAFERTLNDLQLDFLDQYLIHWPVPIKYQNDYIEKNQETWRAIETLYKQGKVRIIGVSNFLQHHVEELLVNAEIAPMVNQIEIHPGCSQLELVQYCKERNIVVEAYSPFGTGSIFKMPDLISLSRKYGKSIAQICLRWCIQKDIIPIPRSKNEERIKDNMSVFDFFLEEQDIQLINEIGDNIRLDPDKIEF